MKTVRVRLGERSYTIQIGKGLLSRVGEAAQKLSLGKRAAVLTDRTVGRRYARPVLRSLKKCGFAPLLIQVPPGEKSKSVERAKQIWAQLLAAGLDRSSFIVALGGGVVGDLAGFVAATYLRGIPFIQVPTTLLAQVDSSVGGKVAVNLPQGKNLIGAFYQPRAVLIDTAVLKTLPPRELRAGLAEVIKYGIIWDKSFFDFLNQNLKALFALNEEALVKAIATSCAIKAYVVEKDEKESGLRAILNYGHTFGHAYEAANGYKTLLHGEAIAAGMVAAAKLSRRLGLCSEETVAAQQEIFRKAGLPTRLSQLSAPSVMRHMQVDKKAEGGKLRFVLVESLGCVTVRKGVPVPLVKEVVKESL